jgi:vacuolar-type H+-ATPase subunit H
MAGKGDSPRPVNRATYEANYEEIFRSCRSTAEQKAQEVSESGETNSATQVSTLDEDNSSAVEQTLQT